MRLIVILALIVAHNSAFSQKHAVYDPYVAAAFDVLNNMPFKQLQLQDTSGRVYNTAALYGKTIYVDFWFTSCSPCLKEIPYSQSLQQFFAADTNIVFLNICIDNIERKSAWKQMIHDKQMRGIHLFYERNRPQKINLLREYELTFPAYMLVNKEMKIIGYNAPRPSEEGWVEWAIAQAKENNFLSKAYIEQVTQSKGYTAFINANWPKIVSLKKE